MTRLISTPTRTVRALTLLGVTAALLISTSSPAQAQSDDSPGLVGTWMVRVTLRDCTSGAALGAPFNSLVTFHQGGTISESAVSAAFAAGQRSPGHGTWDRRRGHTYKQQMIAQVAFDTEPNLPGTASFDPTKPVTPGFFAGWQTVNHTVRFTAADQIASAGTNAFYKANGDVYRSGCSTATGQRFE
jgi:hypothetical protein